MRCSGDWTGSAALTPADLHDRLQAVISQLDVPQARQEVARFLRDRASLDLWSREFFLEIAEKIVTV